MFVYESVTSKVRLFTRVLVLVVRVFVSFILTWSKVRCSVTMMRRMSLVFPRFDAEMEKKKNGKARENNIIDAVFLR